MDSRGGGSDYHMAPIRAIWMRCPYVGGAYGGFCRPNTIGMVTAIHLRSTYRLSFFIRRERELWPVCQGLVAHRPVYLNSLVVTTDIDE